MSGEKKQSTLFNLKGFSQVITRRGETVDIGKNLPKFTTEDPTLLVHCDKCPIKFKSKQGLASHYTWAHDMPSLKLGAGTSLDSISAVPKKKRSIEDDAKCVVSQLVLDVKRKFA